MLVRTRPARPAVAFRTFDRSFDRAFEQLAGSIFTAAPRTPVVDAAWREGDLVLTVDLPGVSAEQVDVSVSGRTLTLSATTPTSSWQRSLTLGSALDPAAVSAHHVDGRLTVTVAAAATPEARTIEISTNAPVAAVEAAPEHVEATPEVEAQPENATSDGE
jgi:HSP20 family protein